MGFAFGDSVDILFSNGSELRGIPYYNGFYVNPGDVLLVGYPGFSSIKVTINYYDTLWNDLDLKDGDTATITLAEAGKFRSVQDALSISYTDEREDYPALSDAQYANYREAKSGALKPKTLYRSASPIDDQHGRADYAGSQMTQDGVVYVLNLSDSRDEIAGHLAEDEQKDVDTSHFANLLDSGCVAACDLSASYPSPEFAKSLAAGLVDMSAHEGPYLVHCVEGKDRTGFVCMLLEALAGATYDEMLDDYMITYENYYGITREGNPEQYATIANQNLNGMLRFLANANDDADLRTIDYTDPARNYLLNAGMTEEQIDALRTRIAS